MAKYRRGKKIQPAQMNITVSLQPGANYVDLSQVASLVNRRFYRQGINWSVAGFKAYKPTPTESGASGIVISKLPNTWVMSNAWEKSFRTWQKMNDESLAETESIRPKFLDFKVYMDEDHHQLGGISNLVPQTDEGVFNVDWNPTVGRTEGLGDWEYSKIYIPDTTSPGTVDTREIIAVGRNFPGAGHSGFNAVSMIEGYAASRGLPNVLDPNAPSDADSASGIAPQNWMAALFNEGTTQDTAVLDDMINENNQAPYPFENADIPDAVAPNPLVYDDTQYPGGANQLPGLELVDAAYFNAGTNANTLRLKGSNFPCGLIKILSSEQCGLIIELIPGHHRGYLCEPMTEM